MQKFGNIHHLQGGESEEHAHTSGTQYEDWHKDAHTDKMESDSDSDDEHKGEEEMMDEGERAVKLLSSMAFANAFSPLAMYVYSLSSTSSLWFGNVFTSGKSSWHNAAINFTIWG